MIVAKNLRVTSQMSTIAAGTTTAANCFGGLWLEFAPVIRMGGGAVSWGSSKVTSYSRSSAKISEQVARLERHRHNIPTACFGLVNPQQVSIL
jgi:hypothetical protein